MPKPIAIVIAALIALSAEAQKKPVTIEAITEKHEPAGFGPVQWAPDGKRFAFIEEKKIWLYDVPSGQKKELANLADFDSKAVKPPESEAFDWQNRRVHEQHFAWSGSGKEMLVSTEGDLFLLHVETGKWDQLTATAEPEHDPKLSPDSRYVSFRRNHDLYVLEIAGGRITRLTHDGSRTLYNAELDWVYPEELELGTAHWWSPDSKHIAYLQFDVSREPIYPQVDATSLHARLEPERFSQAGDPNPEVRVGVVSIDSGVTRWMDFGDPRGHLTARVAWLLDSRAVAVERLNRIQNRLDLLFADAASGAAHTVLHEEDPYWININDDLRFLKDGKRFLWGSERDGFHHLYLYSLDGKRLRQLTEGQWEVETVAGLDESAGEIYFVSTEQSPVERHLYSVRLDGKHRRKLTTEEGTHAISMSPTCEYYLDTASSLSSPPRRTIHKNDASEVAVFREADKSESDEYAIPPTEIHRVKAKDGTTLYARLIKPAGFAPGKKYPVIVVVYGGPHAQAVNNAWPGMGWDQVLAQRGFVVWQLDNRGSSGRGHQWESVIFRNMGEHELEDQKEGIRYLESLGFADTLHMGIYGWSYGGYMTLYSLTHAPGLFRAGIAGAPVTHWRNYDSIYTERYMGLPAENPEAYQRTSPITTAADLSARLLLVHNLEDDNVHFQNTVQMMDALERAGKPFDLMLYTQKQHGVTGTVRRHLYETLTEFFEKNVK
ncbi:MAG TPA: DPP IV N-terminal domain-containing protein [Bryobacteraceae bacterium]|nr:DPP IV N-terminal domain-containing protein [Bryobacteraceae bacterium]